MPRVFTRLPRPPSQRAGPGLARVTAAVLAPAAWAAAGVLGLPGLGFHARSVWLGVRLLRAGGQPSLRSIATALILHPIDSVRYFEFGCLWRWVRRQDAVCDYLDLSSPRLFPLSVAAAYPAARCEFANPDARDLDVTKTVAGALGLGGRCGLHALRVEDLPFVGARFDLITTISVLEHIPEERTALERLWELLRPGGRLLVTLPCAAQGLEEHVDFNEYGLLPTDEEGFVFGQRFYDEGMLRERVFSVIGAPARQSVFGERRPGAFAANRAAKLGGVRYPAWKEPLTTALDYRAFDEASHLPGWGVVALEFVKPR